MIDYLEVGTLFLQLSGGAWVVYVPNANNNFEFSISHPSGLAAWFLSWPGTIFSYASDCSQAALLGFGVTR